MEHSSMFDFLYDTYKIKNKIKLIECFSGYGSQNLALKYLGANYEHHRIVEWATKSIQAYNDIHVRDYTDYSQCCTYDEVVNYLVKKGISMDYKKPMTLDQIKRKGENWCRNVYNNIIATRNLVNIMNVKAEDLDITNKEDYTYLLFYSYPCQSLSLAGKREGMKKGSGTESSMLWEIERILRECYELNCLPQVLVMENVIGCCDQKNISDFQEWVTFLESLGYKNYFKIMNAKDFLIPQNRERVFMVSILGDYNYNFANEVDLKLRLKNLLEDIVDEKYYLSQQMVDGMQKTNFESYKLENKLLDKDGIANCIIARYEGAPQCIEDNNSIINLKRGYSCEVAKEKEDSVEIDYIGNYSKSNFNQTSIVGKNGVAPTVTENHGQVTAIVEKNKYSDYSMKKIQGNIIKGDVCGTITASAMQSLTHDNCHLVVEDTPKLIGGIGEKKSNGGSQYYQQDRVYDGNGIAMCHPENLPSGSYMYQINNLRIRKLSPKECFRLMGVKDEDFDNVCTNQSDSSLWHLAGDSIVTTCLMAIFGELLGIDWKENLTKKSGGIMKEIQISKYPDRKKTAIVVYDSETNTGYVVGYFNKEENIPLFLEALCNKIYVKDDDNNE